MNGMDTAAVPPIIAISDGDLEIYDDVRAASGYFCYPDAVSDDLDVLDSTGQFLRAKVYDRYAARFEVDTSRPADPKYLAEQLGRWIEATCDRVDYGDVDTHTAALPQLIEAVRTGRRMGPEPTLLNEFRRIFRR
jgi:hypothetical protein